MKYLNLFESFNNEEDLIESIADCMVDLEDFLYKYQDCRGTMTKHYICFYEYDIPKNNLYRVKELEEKLIANDIKFQLSCSISDRDKRAIEINMAKQHYTEDIDSAQKIYDCDLYYVGFLFMPYKNY